MSSATRGDNAVASVMVKHAAIGVTEISLSLHSSFVGSVLSGSVGKGAVRFLAWLEAAHSG